jgi:hypothetical protein
MRRRSVALDAWPATLRFVGIPPGTPDRRCGRPDPACVAQAMHLAATGSVRPIAPLRDKPLKAHGAGVSEHGSSFTLGTVQMLAELNASIHLT